MNTPLITWGCIVALFVIVLIVRLYRAVTFCAKGRHRFISFGSEREEFYIPGDPDIHKANEEYDYKDFEDL